MADTFSSLPDIELNANEIRLIKEMANELSKNGAVAENSFCVRHPTKSALIENRAQWETNAFDASELLRMMKDIHSLRHIIVAALAAQYRSFLPGEVLPEGIYNFVIPPKSSNSDLWFYSVFQSLTFTNAPGKNVSGPITITMKETDDLKRWRYCHERLAVIRTATGCTEALYNAFIKRCRDMGIWNEDNKSVKLEPGNSGTIAAVSFFLKKSKEP